MGSRHGTPEASRPAVGPFRAAKNKETLSVKEEGKDSIEDFLLTFPYVPLCMRGSTLPSLHSFRERMVFTGVLRFFYWGARGVSWWVPLLGFCEFVRIILYPLLPQIMWYPSWLYNYAANVWVFLMKPASLRLPIYLVMDVCFWNPKSVVGINQSKTWEFPAGYDYKRHNNYYSQEEEKSAEFIILLEQAIWLSSYAIACTFGV